MNITPTEIRNREFKQRWLGGFDMDEVESFLRAVAEEMEDLINENADLNARIKGMEGELEEFRRKRNLLEDAILSAQKVIDEMRTNAKKEAELILKDAELQTDQWVAAANAQVIEIKREISELEMLRKDYELKFRALVESHLELLDMVNGTERRDLSRPRKDEDSRGTGEQRSRGERVKG